MLLVKHLEHLSFFNDQHSAGRSCRSRPDANGLTRQTAFAKKIPRSQDRHDGFLTNFIKNGQLHTALLYVHHALSGITLRIENRRSLKLLNFSRHTRRIEKSLSIENALPLELCVGFDVARSRDCSHQPPLSHKIADSDDSQQGSRLATPVFSGSLA